jgi:2-dehydro-3-deoxyphosphogluconate aldolase/(4S)-4-hydroxy-2-oxoglutarate aldolase
VDERAHDLRASEAASIIRTVRLVAILRRVSPGTALLALVDELAQAGARAFEITFDADTAADDLAACRLLLPATGPDRCIVGAGTLRDTTRLGIARDAGADFGVAPVLDRAVLHAAIDAQLPFIPGAHSPTEIDSAWREGATFVKVFPASSLGPGHIREVRGPLPEIEMIPTGGVDASNARDFLEAGAVAIGIGSALVRATPTERRAIVEAIR